MVSDTRRKNPILLLALVTAFAAAVSFGIVTASAETPKGHEYLEGGESSYAQLVCEAPSPGRDGLISDLESVFGEADDYARVLGDYYGGGVTELGDLFSVAREYDALLAHVESFNAAAAENGYDVSVSVKEKFDYGTEGAPNLKPSDITKEVASAALAKIDEAANGWRGISEYDYPIKYDILYSGKPLFEVYTNTTGDPLINDCTDRVSDQTVGSAKNGVLELGFRYEGALYDLTVSINTQNSVDGNISFGRQYDVSLITVKKNGSAIYEKKNGGDAPFEVALDTEYMEKAKTVDAICKEAKTYFSAPVISEMEARCEGFLTAIEGKIECVREVAAAKLTSAYDECNQALYDNFERTVAKFYNDALSAIRAAADQTALDSAYSEGIEKILGEPTVPEKFRADFASIIINDRIYTETEYGSAGEALEKLSGYKAEQSVLLEAEKAVILENYRNTAVKTVEKALTAEIARQLGIEPSNGSVSDAAIKNKILQLPDETIRSVSKECRDTVNKICASSSVAAIKDYVETYTESVARSVSVDSVMGLAHGNVEITGQFKANTNLTADVKISDEAAKINEYKKNNALIRRLSALETITIKIGGNFDYSVAMNQNYAVKVSLSEETIEKFRRKEIDGASVVIAYVDDYGNIETYQTTLTLVCNGKTVDLSSAESVDWENIEGGQIMFTTMHFSTYYLMGNTSNLAVSRLANLLDGVTDSELLMPLIIGVAAIIGVILLFVLIAFIVSISRRYSLKFVTNGGTAVKKISGKYGKPLPELPVPEKEGYVFAGWYITPSLKYAFNRKVMPRADVTLYGKWVEEPEDPMIGLLEKFDGLRAKLASLSKDTSAETSFIDKEIFAKLCIADGAVQLLVRNTREYINTADNGKPYVIPEADKFYAYTVSDDESYSAALAAIDGVAALYELAAADESSLSPATAEEALAGCEFAVTYTNVVPEAERYSCLHDYIYKFSVSDENAEDGKLIAEIVPCGTGLVLGAALCPAKYADILSYSEGAGELSSVYPISSGEDMYVALYLIDNLMAENGLAVSEEEKEAEDYDKTAIYKYVIVNPSEEAVEEIAEVPVEEPAEEPEEEPAEEPAEEPEEEPVEEEGASAVIEEPTLETLFAQLRIYVRSYGLNTAEGVEIDFTKEGLVVLSAKLADGKITVSIDPSLAGEEITYDSLAEFEGVKEKIAAMMVAYNMVYSEKNAPSEAELDDATSFRYRIKYGVEASPVEILSAIRHYTAGYALYGEDTAEVDKSIEGKVIVTAVNGDDVVTVNVDPDGDAKEFKIEKVEELRPVLDAIDAAMKKYGFEKDAEYVPGELAEGNSFGFRVKF